LPLTAIAAIYGVIVGSLAGAAGGGEAMLGLFIVGAVGAIGLTGGLTGTESIGVGAGVAIVGADAAALTPASRALLRSAGRTRAAGARATVVVVRVL
jgi:hypothetical protein